GAEAILQSANRVLSQRHGDGSLAMLTVDFSNAFNMSGGEIVSWGWPGIELSGRLS
ncbi:hypothetical protein A2U01_0050750, partial [Trifolium medium]|nr:hypothetical protein [Trifolium medium]